MKVKKFKPLYRGGRSQMTKERAKAKEWFRALCVRTVADQPFDVRAHVTETIVPKASCVSCPDHQSDHDYKFVFYLPRLAGSFTILKSTGSVNTDRLRDALIADWHRLHPALHEERVRSDNIKLWKRQYRHTMPTCKGCSVSVSRTRPGYVDVLILTGSPGFIARDVSMDHCRNILATMIAARNMLVTNVSTILNCTPDELSKMEIFDYVDAVTR